MEVILSTITEKQAVILRDAAMAALDAKSRYEMMDRIYKTNLAMIMPEGAEGFDPVRGVFYREEPDAGPELVPDIDVQMAEALRPMDPETEYPGSPDNAKVEGALAEDCGCDTEPCPLGAGDES